MRRTALIATALCAVVWSSTAVAGDYAAANSAYLQGDFSGAAVGYQTLVDEGGFHEDLYYNLGNAYFRSAKLGLAIFNFERALRIEPAFADARYNLEVARETVAERVVDRLKGAESEPLWVRAVTFFSITQLTIAFFAFNLLFFASLLVLRFLATGFTRTALVVTTTFVGVALVASLLLLNRHIYVLERIHQGIVLADQVTMREGPDNSLAERGQLHPGLRLRVLVREPGWFKVRLSNGVEGWLPEESIGEL